MRPSLLLWPLALSLGCAPPRRGGGGGSSSGEGEGAAEAGVWTAEGPEGSAEGSAEGSGDPAEGEEGNTEGEPGESDQGDPNADDGQRAALARINALRREAGQTQVRFDPALNRAAQAHADYYQDNLPRSQADGHGESHPDWPRYTGADPGSRAQAAGYSGPMAIYEDMAFGVGPQGAVQVWFDSVYHRVPIVRPDAVLVGFGHRADVEVLDVAMSGDGGDRIALTPPDGATGVPTAFESDYEGPDPVPEASTVGYPVSLMTARYDVSFVEGSLTPAGGDPGEMYVAHATHPIPGFLSESVFLMTKRPLRGNTSYLARIAVRTGASTLERSWRFTTR